jgi:hypothetical protein
MRGSALWLALGIAIALYFFVDWLFGLGSLAPGTPFWAFLLGWLSGGFITAAWCERRSGLALSPPLATLHPKGFLRQTAVGFVRLTPVWMMLLILAAQGDLLRQLPPWVRVVVILAVVALSVAFMKLLLKPVREHETAK